MTDCILIIIMMTNHNTKIYSEFLYVLFDSSLVNLSKLMVLTYVYSC